MSKNFVGPKVFLSKVSAPKKLFDIFYFPNDQLIGGMGRPWKEKIPHQSQSLARASTSFYSPDQGMLEKWKSPVVPSTS
jgi:hypothetical protein